ncbi:MAG TPA: D-alanyl-D-alanine carboxypeptidase [Desulfosporosinus sp.]|nr:D-alanyl-D-alanine carboxypeptidase [Desulfosporosinus sp.]
MRKTKKRKSKFWVLLLIVVIIFIYNSNIDLNGQSLFRKISPYKDVSIPLLKVASDSAVSVPLDNLYSSNAILVRLDNHSVLMQKNSKQRIYPASLTKIMTAIVAIESLQDLQENVDLPNSLFQKLYKADASMAGFKPDEKVRAIDLLYGIMLPSGAECCIGLADHIAGSEQKFIEMMNQKAGVLGMSNTHFTNSTGLQDNNHYTTVKDLSLLLSYALQNTTFRDIFTASRYSIAPTNKHPNGITFQNTMFKNITNPVVDGGKILGGKTGYTVEAGLCLASLAQKNGREYILVTAGAKGNHESEQYNLDDAYTVYNKLGK